MQRFIYRHLLLPAFETGLHRRKTFRYLKELEHSQWQPLSELEAMQFDRLKALLNHAFRHCDYYREAWQQRGLDPRRLQDLADFAKWPLLHRKTIVAERLRMRSDAPGLRFLSKSTGGSSGVPLHFDLDTGSNEMRMAATYRGYSWAHAGPGTKQLYLWGVPLGKKPRWRNCKDALYDRLQRRLVLNSFEFSDARVPYFLKRHNAYRPDVIVAYTNPLYFFARALDERGIKPWAPQSIVVGAEKIHPFQRDVIERVFQAPVFETYGSREFMLIGAECVRHAGLHLTLENHFLEVLDDQGRPVPDGQEGNVVVTDLTNYGMPFVRYVCGDRAIAGWQACSCGRGLPLLRKVVGRRLDMLRTPDNRRIPGEFFPHLIKDFPGIQRFQVIQEELDRIQVRLVLKPTWNGTAQSLLENEIRKIAGPMVRVELQPVNEIPLSAVGKLQVVVNRLPDLRLADPPALDDSID